MAGFKKSEGFRGGGARQGGFQRGGSVRPQFANKSFSRGNDRGGRDGDRPVQMFQATCAQCGKSCEVPFRPNGEKPVFCRDCFSEKRGAPVAHDRREAPRDFGKRDREFTQAPAGTRAPAPDSRIDDLKRQVDAMHKKLDAVALMIEGMTKTPEVAKNTESLTSVVNKVAGKAAKATKAAKNTEKSKSRGSK